MDVESLATLSAVAQQLTDSLGALQQKTVGDLGFLVGKVQDRWRDETITPVLAAVASLHSDIADLTTVLSRAEALLEKITAVGFGSGSRRHGPSLRYGQTAPFAG